MIDKPAGWTSHDVVAKVRGIINAGTGQKIKVGHTGTLDPAATGLMVLVLGGYTKRASEFSKLDKTYEAELTLGATSSTGDSEGKITPTTGFNKSKYSTRSRKILSYITEVVKSFEGTIWQKPPAFSAVKINGRRAYKLARAGKTVEIEPRQVKIYEIRDVKYNYPKLSFTTSVSSGTYIRTLAADIGAKLGTGAYLSVLRRTSVGKFNIKKALALDSLDLGKTRRGLLNHL